jgi:hypothetical protein
VEGNGDSARSAQGSKDDGNEIQLEQCVCRGTSNTVGTPKSGDTQTHNGVPNSVGMPKHNGTPKSGGTPKHNGTPKSGSTPKRNGTPKSGSTPKHMIHQRVVVYKK